MTTFKIQIFRNIKGTEVISQSYSMLKTLEDINFVHIQLVFPNFGYILNLH